MQGLSLGHGAVDLELTCDSIPLGCTFGQSDEFPRNLPAQSLEEYAKEFYAVEAPGDVYTR